MNFGEVRCYCDNFFCFRVGGQHFDGSLDIIERSGCVLDECGWGRRRIDVSKTKEV